jgi:3D (Asp-Asp-Asp) domain-containing protein
MRSERPARTRYLLIAVLACLGLAASGLADQSGARVRTERSRLRPGARLAFHATAYCQDGTTRSGVDTRHGIAAADPKVLPVGSVIRVDTPEREHKGIYSVLDTGSAVKGRIIDLFVRDCEEATEFGRQQVMVKILRLGWSPQASAREGAD